MLIFFKTQIQKCLGLDYYFIRFIPPLTWSVKKQMRLSKIGLYRLQKQSRQKKYDSFVKFLRPVQSDKVLDLGGGPGNYFESLYPWPDNVVVLDIDMRELRKLSKGVPTIGDAMALPFADYAFDIVFSNAVIEHVGNFNCQKLFASEVRRVGGAYFVTTPWKGFPLELHYKLPLYQFVPKKLQRQLSKHFELGWYNRGQWEDINLLWHHQLRDLFPDSVIIKQRVSVWPETLIAYRAK